MNPEGSAAAGNADPVRAAAAATATPDHPGAEGVIWFVAHTRPRREKKLEQYCAEKGVETTLPLYRTVHKYRGKTVSFHKPLFPGYLFLKIHPTQRPQIYQSDHVANLLDVFDQDTFERQLEDILRALDTDLEIQLAPQIGEGSRVLIRSGPLQGMEGWVERRHGPTVVLLRLDFIGQAAAVNVDANDLELS